MAFRIAYINLRHPLRWVLRPSFESTILNTCSFLSLLRTRISVCIEAECEANAFQVDLKHLGQVDGGWFSKFCSVTKHLYDSAEGLVLKSLRGAVALNPALRLHEPSKTVFIADQPRTKNHVAVISGGGSGHEPAHAGYTGKGMLAASVAGDIFASPSARQILTTIQLASQSGSKDHPPLDVLAIINNYTGDRLNFGLAIEKARTLLPGVNIETVIVADDISLLKQNANNKFVGPRGLAANILVCKILGALAETGESLRNVKALGDALVGNLVSLGVGLDHCHVPGRSRKTGSTLGKDECELGLGLHNEPGVAKQGIGDPSQLVDQMVTMLLNDSASDPETFLRQCQDGIVLFINNLGGMSQLEMGAIVNDVTDRLAMNSVHPTRTYCSSYMTSLNAPGFSLSILNIAGVKHSLSGAEISLEAHPIETLLDMPTDAFAWVGARSNWPNPGVVAETSVATLHEELIRKRTPSEAQVKMSELAVHIESGLRGACRAVLEVKEDLTEFDTIVGDGDCGDTFSAGANAVISALNDGSLLPGQDGSSIVQDIANILEDSMGGTVGALFAIFLNGLAVALTANRSGQPQMNLANALESALKTLSRYTPAQVGDRTIMDALIPFCETISAGGSLEKAVKEARVGAERTRGMEAHLGRAAYMNSSVDTTGIPPDPGAWGVYIALEGFVTGIVQNGQGGGRPNSRRGLN